MHCSDTFVTLDKEEMAQCPADVFSESLNQISPFLNFSARDQVFITTIGVQINTSPTMASKCLSQSLRCKLCY